MICHGDFHPRNLLVAAGQVTGVLDWPNALVADAELDVAPTLNILRFVPADLAAPSSVTRALAQRRQTDPRRPLSERDTVAAAASTRSRLAYYEVATAMRALVQTGEARAGAAERSARSSGRVYATGLVARARQLTGVAVTLPTVHAEP